MKLMTKEIEARFAKVGKQENVKDPIVICKFFNPTGAGTWYATEMYYVIKKDRPREEPEIIEVEASKLDESIGGEIVDMVFFGYVSIFGDHCDEWGYFSLDELESVKGPFGVGIERDLHWTPRPISEVCQKACYGKEP
jgi:hypothetical protein